MIAYLAIGCAWFAAVITILAFFHACELSRETERNASPDDAGHQRRIGNRGEIIVHHDRGGN